MYYPYTMKNSFESDSNLSSTFGPIRAWFHLQRTQVLWFFFLRRPLLMNKKGDDHPTLLCWGQKQVLALPLRQLWQSISEIGYSYQQLVTKISFYCSQNIHFIFELSEKTMQTSIWIFILICFRIMLFFWK